MLKDTNPSRTARRFLKRFMYAQLSLRDAFLILVGKEKPSLSFKVLADPCSVYINFAVKKGMEREFASYINLPKGLSPVPVSCRPVPRRWRGAPGRRRGPDARACRSRRGR